MDRRAVIRVVGLVLTGGCLSSPPRATGPRKPPTEPAGGPSTATPEPKASTRVADLDLEESPDGDLNLVATVVNEGASAQTRTLRGTARLNGETHVQTTEVSVAAGAEREVTLSFDVPYSEFTGNGSVNVELR